MCGQRIEVTCKPSGSSWKAQTKCWRQSGDSLPSWTKWLPTYRAREGYEVQFYFSARTIGNLLFKIRWHESWKGEHGIHRLHKTECPVARIQTLQSHSCQRVLPAALRVRYLANQIGIGICRRDTESVDKGRAEVGDRKQISECRLTSQSG